METSNRIVSQVAFELTASQCNEIIERKINSKNFKIIDFKLIALDTRNGFFGEHKRLLITIVKNNRGTETTEAVHCFAKFLPENPKQFEFAVTCGVFKKEIFIYQKLLSRIENFGINYVKNVIPECYYTKDDFVLVFEDVTKNGFKSLSKYGYLNYEHVLVTIKSMAKLHAACLIFEEKMSLNNNSTYRLLDDYEDCFYETFFVNKPQHKGGQAVNSALKGMYAGLALFPEENFDLNNNQFRLNVEKACLDIFELVKPSKKYRNCVCHGDLWSTNIMIKYDKNNKPIDCLMLDFQTARYCPPGHDFMSFIFLTTTREFRSKHMINLQQIYYDELKLLLAKYGFDISIVIPFKEFLESCEEQKLFAIMQTIIYVQLTQVKEESVAEFMQKRELWDEALYVDRSKMMKLCCETDPKYRAVFLEALKNVKDIL